MKTLIYFIMKSKLTKLIIIFFFILIFLKKDLMYITIYETTLIWFKNIVPNLLPMFIITSLFVSSNLIINVCNLFGKPFSKIFRVSKYGIFVFTLSLFTGSPSNAKYINDLVKNNMISVEEGNKLLVFTTNYNLLLIYSLLTLYLDSKTSILIIIIIILSNIILGLLNRNIDIEKTKFNYKQSNTNLSLIIKETIDTLLMILGTLIVFNIIINILPIKNIIIKNILNGILEITTSLNGLKYLNISNDIKILLSTIYLSFGGLSIHTQIKSIFKDTDYKFFIKNKLYSIIIALILLNLTFWII